MICAFTGHRPEHLPWGRDEDDPRCRALKILLRRTVQQVYDRGFRTFLCGMAMGFDLADISDELRFIPLYPELKTGTVLVWKKNQANSPAAGAFLRRLRNVHEA